MARIVHEFNSLKLKLFCRRIVTNCHDFFKFSNSRTILKIVNEFNSLDNLCTYFGRISQKKWEIRVGFSVQKRDFSNKGWHIFYATETEHSNFFIIRIYNIAWCILSIRPTGADVWAVADTLDEI